MIYFQAIGITGEINKTVYDDGLKSTEENPKTLISILAQVESYKDTNLQAYYEREKIFDIPDSLMDTTESTGSTNTQKSYNRLLEIPVGMKIPPGQKIRLALKSGATTTNIKGAYKYEIAK